MALTPRTHNPFENRPDIIYMLLDVTTVEGTRCIKTGSMRRVQLLGQLAEFEGKKVIAPVIEGRGFSKLSQDQLNYLFWNHTGKSPAEFSYAELIQECVDIFLGMPPADEHVPSLEFLVSQTKPVVLDVVTGEVVVKDTTPQRPKGTTTTGIIWSICDEVLTALHAGVMPDDFKPLRAEAWKRCDAEGFNSGTFGVQYGKWKASKLAGK